MYIYMYIYMYICIYIYTCIYYCEEIENNTLPENTHSGQLMFIDSLRTLITLFL